MFTDEDDDDGDEYIIHGKLLDPIHEGELLSCVTIHKLI